MTLPALLLACSPCARILAAPDAPANTIEPDPYGLDEDCVVDPAYVTGGAVCLPCGDGVCDAPIENRCNCAVDCHPG